MTAVGRVEVHDPERFPQGFWAAGGPVAGAVAGGHQVMVTQGTQENKKKEKKYPHGKNIFPELGLRKPHTYRVQEI